MALPGSPYVYQGEELGLPEAEDIAVDRIRDPMYLRSNGVDPGRDGCRVPLPWSGDEPPYGFSAPGTSADPWLPQPMSWAELTAEAQVADPKSMLQLYRAALRLRRSEAGLGDGHLDWLPAPDQVLAFRRGDRFACVVNLSDQSVDLPMHDELLIASTDVTSGRLPTDAAAWLRLPTTKEQQ